MARSHSAMRPGRIRKRPTTIRNPAGAQGADTGRASLFNVFGGPSMAGSVHVSKDIRPCGRLFRSLLRCLSLGQEPGLRRLDDVPPGGGRRATCWFAIDGKIEVLYFSAGAAYRIGPVSIGASGNFISSTVSLLQARNIGGTGKPDAIEEGRGSFDVHGYNGSFGAGVTFEAIPERLYVGASYQAQPGMGPQALNGDLYVTPPGQKATHYDVTLHQSLPDVFRAGARFRPKNVPWEFRVFGDYTRWGVLTSQCLAEQDGACAIGPNGAASTGPGDATVLANVRRNWKDTWGLRAGASYWVAPAIEAFAGVGYETAAVPGTTMSPDIPDADNVLLAVGGRFALTEHLFSSVSYTHIQYFDRNVSPTTSTLATSPSGVPYVYPTVEGNGGGQYTQWIGLFTGNLEATF